jgi:hypothetical protein
MLLLLLLHDICCVAAVVGGVFTVAGILDSVLYTGMNMAKKIELGKQG